MGRHYTQLGIEDRCELARLYAQGRSLRQIATALDRAPSTIARELKRNTSRPQGYRPQYAQEQARARRWGGARLDRDAGLREQVLARLKHGWSPEQIAGRLRRDAGRTIIAHETIYRFIYAQTTRTKPARGWRHYQPPRQVAPGLAWTPGRQCRLPHLPPAPPGGAARHRHRPPDPRALGSRSDALPHLRPSGADGA